MNFLSAFLRFNRRLLVENVLRDKSVERWAVIAQLGHLVAAVLLLVCLFRPSQEFLWLGVGIMVPVQIFGTVMTLNRSK